MKKIIAFLSSMKLALGLLLFLALGSIAGTLSPQNLTGPAYVEAYGSGGAAIIRVLSLDQVYRAPWYIALTLALLISLFFCIIRRLGPLVRTWKRGGDRKALIRPLANWTLHLSLALLLLSFMASAAFAFDGSVACVPGETVPVEGTPLHLHVSDFSIDMNGSFVSQYRSEVKIADQEGYVLDSGTIEVNAPMTVQGVQFSQASYGYALDVAFSFKGKPLGKTVLYQGNYAYPQNGGLAVYLSQLYPDFVLTPQGPATRSQDLNRPYFEYQTYFNKNFIDQGLLSVDETLTYQDYEISFSNPRLYTLLQVRKDPFLPLVFISAALLFISLCGVFLAPQSPHKEEV